MYVHDEYKIAYLAHPRTASTATCKALRKQADFRSVKAHHAIPTENIDIDFSNGWTIVSTVRNHFEVFRSWLLNTNYSDEDDLLTPSILELIHERERYFKNRYPAPFRQLFYHIPYCTDYIRYENLDEEINDLLEYDIEIPVYNVSEQTDKTYQELITSEARDWIESNYAIEMERYGYSW